MNRRHRDFQSHALPAELPRHKGARWDSNPLHAEPQSAAYPLRLLAQYRYRESNPDQEIRSLLSYPLDHIGIVRVTGIEPATRGLKVRYLTTWLHAHIFLSPLMLTFQPIMAMFISIEEINHVKNVFNSFHVNHLQ